jgi:hypothetical protein
MRTEHTGQVKRSATRLSLDQSRIPGILLIPLHRHHLQSPTDIKGILDRVHVHLDSVVMFFEIALDHIDHRLLILWCIVVAL